MPRWHILAKTYSDYWFSAFPTHEDVPISGRKSTTLDLGTKYYLKEDLASKVLAVPSTWNRSHRSPNGTKTNPEEHPIAWYCFVLSHTWWLSGTISQLLFRWTRQHWRSKPELLKQSTYSSLLSSLWHKYHGQNRVATSDNYSQIREWLFNVK